MFYVASSFNLDVSRWNTGRVTDMGSMFYGASKFNQDISRWDTSNVTDMDEMFTDATSFCQNISSWSTASLRQRLEYDDVFDGASSFRRQYSPRFERETGN